MFFKTNAENDAERLVPDLSLKKKKRAFYEIKLSGLEVKFNLLIALNLAYNESKLYKTLDLWSGEMLNFSFFEKGLEIVSEPYFVYYFWRKMSLILYSSNWLNFIAWLPLLLEILGNMCIVVAC